MNLASIKESVYEREQWWKRENRDRTCVYERNRIC